MKNIVAHDFLVLRPGQLISVTSDVARLMRIDCGLVWVTIEGEAIDYWLFGGDSLALIAGRHVVIEADKLFSRIDFLPGDRQQAASLERTRFRSKLRIRASRIWNGDGSSLTHPKWRRALCAVTMLLTVYSALAIWR